VGQVVVANGPFSGQVDTLVIATPLTDVVATLHTLVWTEVGVSLAAVLIAVAVGAWLVRVGLRPLEDMAETADEIAAGHLDRRVDTTDAATEVGRLGTALNSMLGRIETAFDEKEESEHRLRRFIADASHELRTPLTSIRGYAELARMQRAMGAETDPEGLDRIEAEGTRMSRLVEDLLMLARSDQGAAPVTEVIDLAGLSDEAAAGVRAAHPDRPIEVRVPAGLTVLADPDQLLRVLRNLIANAAVHTAPGGPIRVTGFRDGPQVVLQVADSGPGLPPEEAAHVFERFWRADKARTRAKGGSGLGLAIVRSIVEAHGGTVGFESSVAGGSTVSVRLPG
jgi:two-component system OmpR family sensor kinase